MIFDYTRYLQEIHSPKNEVTVRRVERGFSSFVAAAANRCFEITESAKPSLVELGIGGGGNHLQWQEYFTGDIYGVDLFDNSKRDFYNTSDGYGYYRDYFDELVEDTNNAQKSLNEAGIKHYWGLDAYSESTAKIIADEHQYPIDFVLDDAAPSDGALRGLNPAWQNVLADTGCMITETPFGNGTPEVVSYSREKCMHYLNILADEGMILLDMSEYATKDPNPKIDYIISYLGFYSPNYNNYDELLQTYEHNIVAGKHNWKG